MWFLESELTTQKLTFRLPFALPKGPLAPKQAGEARVDDFIEFAKTDKKTQHFFYSKPVETKKRQQFVYHQVLLKQEDLQSPEGGECRFSL